MKKTGSIVILVSLALFTLTLFQNCGSAGGGGSSDAAASSVWYYHFDCNGDPGCLSTNPTGKSCGDLNQGSAQAACNALVFFGTNFWNAPATHWCDQNPVGSTCSGGTNNGAPKITGMNVATGPGNQIVVLTGSGFPLNAIGITATYCGQNAPVTSSNATQVTVRVPFGTSCKSPITITTGAGSVDSQPYTRYNNLKSAASNGSNIVVSGDNGTIITSPDGVTWTVRTSAINCGSLQCSMNSVVWNGTQFLTVGQSANVHRSFDGNSWSDVHQGGGVGDQALIWTGTQYVSGGSGGVITLSPDGGTWTSGGATPDVYFGLAYNGSVYVSAAQGGIFTSGTGTGWTNRLLSGGFSRKSVATNGTEFKVVGQQGLINSSTDPSDPGSWLQTNVGSFELNGITYASGKYVIVGNSGTIITSEPMIGYTNRTSNTSENLFGIAWTGTKFIALGAKNTILTSPDGVTWTVRPLFP